MQSATSTARKMAGTLFLLAWLPTQVVFAEDRGKAHGWKERLTEELPRLGHRNWIVVADAAYPVQTSSGVETIYAGGDHIEAIQIVLDLISATKHVQAAPQVDAELKAVAESDAPGIGAFREKLDRLLRDRPVSAVPHEDIIRKLDESAELFRVIVIKTDMTLPYTSVFLQLECGYWNADKEKRLREVLKRAQ